MAEGQKIDLKIFHLGTSVAKFNLPIQLITDINKLYDENLKTKLKDLEMAQANVTKEKAEVKLSQLHPDFNDIRADEKFHDWVANQDSTIQGWLYDNTSNANLAARAIDLYKLDAGIGKKVVVDKKEASKAVTSTSKRDIDAKDKKVWTVSEITKLKPAQYLKVEKEIDLARREGRIRN